MQSKDIYFTGLLANMNKYTKNLNRIEFVVTNGCSGHCKHCSQGDHNDKIEHIDTDVAVRLIEDVCRNYSISSLMTFGGEPLLYPETVCKILKTAYDCNIPTRELITNGYFSKAESRIKEVAYELKISGVTKILLSVDAFHQETIPIEPVEYFAGCIIENGIYTEVHPAWLVSKDADNPYNVKTKELLNIFENMGIEVSSGNVIIPTGNAKKYFSEFYDDSNEIKSPYEQNPYDITAISINHNGDILDYNVYKNNIVDILNSYSPNK